MKIDIFGNKYDVKGNVDEVHLKKLSEYVDKKMNEVSGNTTTISSLKVSILVALNIANELFQARNQIKEMSSKSDTLSNIIDKEVSCLEP